MKVLVLTGPMGSGKSTFIEYVKKNAPGKRVVLVKFAERLYQMQEAIYKLAELTPPDVNKGEKDRKLLQWLGTDWGREKNVNIWVDLWKRKVMKELETPDTLVVTDDCRFDNEAAAARSVEATIVQLKVPSEVRQKRINLVNTTHASEAGINADYVNYEYENATSLEHFENAVKFIMEHAG